LDDQRISVRFTATVTLNELVRIYNSKHFGLAIKAKNQISPVVYFEANFESVSTSAIVSSKPIRLMRRGGVLFFAFLLDELKASRVSRKTAWDILQELRSILNEHGVVLAPPAAKNIGGRSFQECASHFIPRRQQSPSDTATKRKRNKRMALESYYLKVVQQTCPLTGRCAYRWTMFRWADRAVLPSGNSGSEGPKATAYLTLNK
jgi:hypothetical protein